jgi:saccharopine dehydrogenase-like NADP-dependent oxidoreductase
MGNILVVGGYGEVGRRVVDLLEVEAPGRVVVGGRNPSRAEGQARRIDVADPASIDAALDGVDVVVACVRQPEPHLLHAAVRRGLAYTSIAPPWLPWPRLGELEQPALTTGARIVVATGIEPGISSVLARTAADLLGGVDTIETALLLGVGDAYGGDSMAFLLGELAERYDVTIDGQPHPMRAFRASTSVVFPAPIGRRIAYAIPFRDQLYYPHTLGARTAIARIALDPAWLGRAIAILTRFAGTRLTGNEHRRALLHAWTERLRKRHPEADRFALLVDVTRGDRRVRATLVGRCQAQATAIATAAVATALDRHEVSAAGVWLVEQAIDPQRFLARLAVHGLVPTIAERAA